MSDNLEVQILGNTAFVHGQLGVPIDQWTSYQSEFILWGRLVAGEGFVISRICRPSDSSPILQATPDGRFFVGRKTGLWELCVAHGFDFDAAAGEIVRTARALNPIGREDPYDHNIVNYRILAGKFYSYLPEFHGIIYDPLTDRIYPGAHSFEVGDQMKVVGNVLLVQPFGGSGLIRTYDISNPTDPVLLKQYEASDLAFFQIGASTVSGNTLVNVDDISYLTVSSSGTLKRLGLSFKRPPTARGVEDLNPIYSSPSATSKVVAEYSEGELVDVLAFGSRGSTSDGRGGRWLRIRTIHGIEGYSLDVYFCVLPYVIDK